MRIFGVVLAIGIMNVMYTNCAKNDLVPLSNADVGVYNYGTVKAQFCTSLPSPGKQNIKYLFIIDHSSLNQPGIRLTPNDTINADPTGARRYGPLVNFVRSLSPNPTSAISFDIIDFADTASQANGLSTFESNSVSFVDVAKSDWIGNGSAAAPAPRDSGFTNYKNALDAAKSLIEADLQASSNLSLANSVAATYQIIFVSGGMPVVAAAANDGSLYTQDFDTDLKPLIDQIMAFKTDATYGPYVSKISLNTAYYYAPTDAADPDAIELLKKIETRGDGRFVNFGGGEQISYEQFAPSQTNLKNELADIFVENMNSVWWKGKFMLDSDADGLPDDIERQLGSDPFKADTDGNGVSDFVEFKTKGQPCAVAGCNPSGRDSYAVCAGFTPQTSASGVVTFNSTSNDGLNDCEKYVLGGNYRSFNSSGSLIPDFYALKNGIAISANTPTVAMQDPFGDGMTNYYKLKLDLPTSMSQKVVADFTQRSTSLTLLNSNAQQSCYSLDVEDVALTAPSNRIRVHVIQNKAVVQDDATLLKAEAAIGAGLTVNFSTNDFN